MGGGVDTRHRNTSTVYRMYFCLFCLATSPLIMKQDSPAVFFIVFKTSVLLNLSRLSWGPCICVLLCRMAECGTVKTLVEAMTSHVDSPLLQAHSLWLHRLFGQTLLMGSLLHRVQHPPDGRLPLSWQRVDLARAMLAAPLSTSRKMKWEKRRSMS